MKNMHEQGKIVGVDNLANLSCLSLIDYSWFLAKISNTQFKNSNLFSSNSLPVQID